MFDAYKRRQKWKTQTCIQLPKLARMVDRVQMVAWITPVSSIRRRCANVDVFPNCLDEG